LFYALPEKKLKKMEFGDVTGALATIDFDTDVYRRAVGSTLSAISEARGTASVSTVTYTARAFARSGAKCAMDDVCSAIKRRGRTLGLSSVVMECEAEKGKFKKRVTRSCVSFKMEDEGARVSVKICRNLVINVAGATGLSSIERTNRRVRALLCSAARGGDEATDEHAVDVRVWSIDMTQVAWFTCDASAAIDVQKMHALAVGTIDSDEGPWKVASLEMRRHTALRLSSHATGERADSKISACVWPCGTITLVGKDPTRARAAVQWIARALTMCRIALSVPRKLTPAQSASRERG
jgi:hypothetical protein